MTLVNCEQCNEDISDSVEVCPHCGYKETDWTDSAKAAEFRKMTHDWRKMVDHIDTRTQCITISG